MKNRRDFLLSGAGAVGLIALSAQAKSSPQPAPAYLKVSSEISQTGMASIRSFLPASFDASDPRADCTKYIQNAINERVQLFLPAGVYNVSPKEGANKQVISSQADSLIKISRIWADFFPANT
ncbi:hypothetical protein NGE66_28715, partial [Klebsiella pneumoniae]|nr:hypothetical protein [Klebsiella pneumoniae]